MYSLLYYKEKPWEIDNEEELYKYAAVVQKYIAILTYGNQLDEQALDELIATYLTEESCDDSNKFNIRYDTYDADVKSPHRNHWIFGIQMDDEQLLEFEATIQRLDGTHVRIQHRSRGHYEVKIDGKLYSTKVYRTRESLKVYREPVEGEYLLFIDEESEDNVLLRSKMHMMPEKLQSLSLSATIPREEWEVYVRDWIKRLLKIIQE
ncbi:hypothetical protein [Lysinibacillus sp. NPDC093216]|uniref:hypothetical protein n=1 Tax=Lysinibacillus sp. NPDC093216 TaxID=3390576 RepID=UPI003D07BDD4